MFQGIVVCYVQNVSDCMLPRVGKGEKSALLDGVMEEIMFVCLFLLLFFGCRRRNRWREASSFTFLPPQCGCAKTRQKSVVINKPHARFCGEAEVEKRSDPYVEIERKGGN